MRYWHGDISDARNVNCELHEQLFDKLFFRCGVLFTIQL